jgi:hypothetical protein
MKRTILLMATSLLIASSLHAIPLTWRFSGTTNSSSEFNGMPIAEGLNYEFRIFLNTDLVGVKDDGNPEVSFFGPHQGEVEIETLGVLSVDPILFVQYFALGGLVTDVIFYNPGFKDIHFDSIISSDSMHLTPIAPTEPNAFFNNTINVEGPNGLFLFGEVVNTFSATTVPEGGSSALLLTSGLVALGSLRRRI